VLEIDPEEKVQESDDKNNVWEPPSSFVTPKKPMEETHSSTKYDIMMFYIVVSLCALAALILPVVGVYLILYHLDKRLPKGEKK